VCLYRVALVLAIACLVFLPVGCRDLREGVHSLPPDGGELPILRHHAGAHCHETRAMQLVIRDPATFARIPLCDVFVDFSEEMLLIVTLGRVTSDQFTVSIDRVRREGHELRVGLTIASPPPNAPVVMASPYCIAIVPHCDLNVADFSLAPPTRIRSWQQSPPPAGP